MHGIGKQMNQFTEQGIQVYQVSDMEWWAGPDRDCTIAAALAAWGIPQEEAFDEFNPIDEVEPCDLDSNTVNLNEDCAPEGPIVSYREHLRAEIAAGVSFPCFFAGEDY